MTTARSKLQYYFRVPQCRARSTDDDDCLCWHDAGTGPLKDEQEMAKSWRCVPVFFNVMGE